MKKNNRREEIMDENRNKMASFQKCTVGVKVDEMGSLIGGRSRQRFHYVVVERWEVPPSTNRKRFNNIHS